MSEEIKPELHEFKVGEWAWSPLYGWARCRPSIETEYKILHGGDTYTQNGFMYSNHKYPTLLTEAQANELGYFKPKQKVKKKITAWANVYSGNKYTIYKTKEQADRVASPNRIACFELSGEYEVEE